MTPAQSRSARALLNLTQPQLAKAADVGLSTIVDFERNRRQVSPQAVAAIAVALQRKGVVFIDDNGGGGEGVRLRHSRKRK